MSEKDDATNSQEGAAGAAPSPEQGDDVKVDIETGDVDQPEVEAVEPDEVETDEVETEEAANDGDLTPEQVEAAIAAGDAAADEDFKSDLEALRAERDELTAKLDGVSGEVEAAHAEAADATDKLARVRADWENYRRRTAAERIEERERATEKLVMSLLPVIDDMERAIEHAPSETDEPVAQFVEGVKAVHAKMIETLQHDGVEVIDPKGEVFNPVEHQAVGRTENKDVYEGMVGDVYQKGYRMGGKIIRSAMVTVTYGGDKRPADPAPEDEATASEE